MVDIRSVRVLSKKHRCNTKISYNNFDIWEASVSPYDPENPYEPPSQKILATAHGFRTYSPSVVIVEDIEVNKFFRRQGFGLAILFALDSVFKSPVVPFCPLEEAALFWDRWERIQDSNLYITSFPTEFLLEEKIKSSMRKYEYAKMGNPSELFTFTSGENSQ